MASMNPTRPPASSAAARFMAGPAGRILRAAIGAAMVGAGLFVVGGAAGLATAAAGLVPIAAGVLNLCPIAPLWGGHFFGAKYCEARPRRR